MTTKEALKIAEKHCAGICSATAHYGTSKRRDRAIRLSGNLQDECRSVAYDIADEISGAVVRCDPGFVAVWL